MSLINEALRKARLDAARQEAADAGIPYPTHGGDPGWRSSSPPWLLGAAVGLLAVAGVGGALFWLGHRSATAPLRVAAAPRESGRDAPAAATEVARPAPGRRSPSEAGVPATDAAPAGPRANVREPAAPTATVADTSTRPTPRAALRPAAESTAATNRVTAAATTPVPAPAQTPVKTPAQTPAQTPVEAPAGAPEPKIERGSPPAELTPAGPAADAASAPVPSGMPQPASGTSAPASPPGAAPAERVFVGEAEMPGGVIRLDGIAWSRERPFALINGRVVGAGDHIQSLTISAVERRRVVLRDDGDGSTYVLQLR